jgi:endonuclease/exonuclease/phosphatase family metal-dependent hydrolase
VIACTHLDLDEAQRMASVPLIVEEAQRWQKPFLLAGDWNDTPDSELIKTMTQYFTVLSDNEATYPADKPNECIDYVGVFNSRAEAIESHVIDEPEASDHRPLVVWVRLR